MATSHYFYNFLDGKIPGTTAAAVASKVFIDQVVWNPIFGVMFFGYVAALEGKGLPFVVEKIKKELLVSVTGSWKVWPIAHTINFRFIPSSSGCCTSTASRSGTTASSRSSPAATRLALAPPHAAGMLRRMHMSRRGLAPPSVGGGAWRGYLLAISQT